LLLPPDHLVDGIMFSGFLSAAFVCLFFQTVLITTISHERLVKYRWNLQEIFISFYLWPG